MAFEHPYRNLLSPIRLGNVVLKNRMIASPSRPFFVQGNENHPTDNWIAHFETKARNGAAVVTCSGSGGENLDPTHGILFDVFDGHAQHYLAMLSEACHFYGTKVNMAVYPIHDRKWDVSTGVPSIFVMGDGSQITYGEEVPEEEILRITDYMAEQCRVLKEDCGFDGAFLHMCYKATLLARSLSPTTNFRTDQYGGSLENRARWPLMVCDAIKEKCGKDFLLHVCITGEEPEEGGWTLQDSIEFARMGVGHFDMLELRCSQIDPNHPIGFEDSPTPWLYMAQAVKEADTGMPVVAISGFTHPDYGEAALAEGKADLVASARAWISNPEYGRMIEEGRGEDVVPCLRCNKCHKSSMSDPWASVCSVNPAWGLEATVDRLVRPVERVRNVAVVGGGPAGMKAALVAAQRGHRVTLYEKSDRLGGLLKCAEHVSFKWTLWDFCRYLVRQVEKAPIAVRLNTEADAAILAAGGYDTVIAAVGSEPAVPAIPGADGDGVFFAPDVCAGIAVPDSDELVIVGGGEIGMETALLLARQGRHVTVLEHKDRPASGATPVHYYSMFMAQWEAEPTLDVVTGVTVTGITPTGVSYRSADGTERTVRCGGTIIATGMRARQEAALALAGTAASFRLVGDCAAAGNVQKAIRSAFGIASAL